MSLSEIEQAALTLPEADRAALVAKLLDTLPTYDGDVSDAEVDQRDRELDSGAVSPISHDELMRRVRQQRSSISH
jgi:Putative addiction module component